MAAVVAAAGFFEIKSKKKNVKNGLERSEYCKEGKMNMKKQNRKILKDS